MDPAALDIVTLSIYASIALLCGIVMQLFTDGFFSGFCLGIAGALAGPFVASELALDPLLIVPVGEALYKIGWSLLGAFSLSITFVLLSRIKITNSRSYA